VLLADVAAITLVVSGDSPEHQSMLVGAIAATCFGLGWLLMMAVALTGRPKILVPPHFRNIDIRKVKKGGYSQHDTGWRGSAVDMSVFLILIPELVWYIIITSTHVDRVIYVAGAAVLLSLGLGGLRLAVVRRRKSPSQKYG
jgi:hypothetical protein